MPRAQFAFAKTDPGVVGMDAFRARELVPRQSSDSAAAAAASKPKTVWGSESQEEKARKAQMISASRDRLADQFVMVRRIAKYLALGALFNVALRKLLTAMLPERWARRAALALVLTSAFRTFGAPTAGIKNTVEQDLPFFGSLLSVGNNVKRMHNYLLNLLRKNQFGTLELRMPGASIFMVMNPVDREYILKTNWRNYQKNRDSDLAGFEYSLGEVLGRGIFATDGVEWQDSRKIASHMFSGNGLKMQAQSVFNAHSLRAFETLEAIAKEGRVLDIQEFFQCVVFDAFCELAFGIFPDATASALRGVKPAFLVAFDFCQVYSSERMVKAPVEWHLHKAFTALTGLGPEAEFLRNLKVVDDYVYKIVNERLVGGNATGKSDLLSLYISYARETGQLHMLDKTYLRDTVVNFMIAGRDTTSCTLTNVCRFLSENPDVVAELRRGDLQRVKDKHEISWEDTRELHYVDAVFNETIRLCPPVGDDFRICVSDDVLPSGIKVRDGSRVFMPNVAIGRDPSLWARPEEFIPERWMSYDAQGAAQRVRRPDEYVLPVFWSGARLCLGKDMSRFEVAVFVAKLFSKLDVESLPGQQAQDWVMGPVIFYANGWKVKVKEAV
jgi:cytochrome P450